MDDLRQEPRSTSLSSVLGSLSQTSPITSASDNTVLPLRGLLSDTFSHPNMVYLLSTTLVPPPSGSLL